MLIKGDRSSEWGNSQYGSVKNQEINFTSLPGMQSQAY
jgi:hypothetical protein